MRPTQGPACGAGRILQVAQGGLFCLFLGAAIFSAVRCGAGESSPVPGRSLGCPSATPADPARLVRLALEAESDGDSVGRERYLAQALAADPDYAPAHWQLGEVRRGDRWIAPIDSARDRESQRRIAEYRRLRGLAQESAADQLHLAHYCQRAGLREQEQMHYTNVFRLDPDSREARDRIDLVEYQGRLMLRQDATARLQEDKLREATIGTWIPRLIALRNGITAGTSSARQQAFLDLAAIHEPDAIPALEAASRLSPGIVGKAVVASLSGMHGQAATDSLVRHAVLAQDIEVRQAAIEGLKERSPYGYVPMLLQYLKLPVDIQFETFFLEDGRPAHRLSMFQEMRDQSQSFVSQGALTATVAVPQSGRGLFRVQSVQDESFDQDVQLSRVMAQYNSVQNEVNSRASAVLRSTTGQNLSTAPQAWWQWWATHNELYSDSEKPVSYMTRLTGTEPVKEVRYHACFVPGTLVWTCSGTLAIEKIKIGELVLAQQPDTGELAYKPVTATTVGTRVPLVEITVGGELIRCTYGHLLWVSGLGWKMAKELKPGQLLHTTSGPLPIDNIERRGAAVCHNLIVADFNTYFVTDQAFLVHDINVRGPTNATVPGLVDEDENPEAPAQP